MHRSCGLPAAATRHKASSGRRAASQERRHATLAANHSINTAHACWLHTQRQEAHPCISPSSSSTQGAFRTTWLKASTPRSYKRQGGGRAGAVVGPAPPAIQAWRRNGQRAAMALQAPARRQRKRLHTRRLPAPADPKWNCTSAPQSAGGPWPASTAGRSQARWEAPQAAVARGTRPGPACGRGATAG